MTDAPKKPSQALKSAGLNELCEAFLLLENQEECRSFLMDLCTPAELEALTERWIIARLLERGDASYRDISAQTGASTTTVGRVARFLAKEPFQGYKLVLSRLKE